MVRISLFQFISKLTNRKANQLFLTKLFRSLSRSPVPSFFTLMLRMLFQRNVELYGGNSLVENFAPKNVEPEGWNLRIQ